MRTSSVEFAYPPPSHMAATMDTQMHDLSHDTLMGLNELDSHLAIFESSDPGRESSTPGAVSISTIDDFAKTVEQSSQTIIVESPEETYSRKFQSDVGSRGLLDKKSMFGSLLQYVYDLCGKFNVDIRLL